MKRKVGIDLVPAASRRRAPGTSRLVEEQARALFKLDVPWDWVPVVEGESNPLFSAVVSMDPVVVPARRLSLHATLSVGRIWRRRGCALGFATAYFTPFDPIPVVANFFDANFYENVDRWHRTQRWMRHGVLRNLFCYSVAKARKLVVLSSYARARLSEVFPRHAGKFVVAPCGIQPPQPSPPDRPRWSDPLDRPFFLYVGSFSDNKNQRTLIEAWGDLQARHADLPALVLIGPQPESYVAEVIRPLHGSLPRPREVLMPGFVAEEELAWAYRHATAYLQPSIAEGFGMPVIEAMSYGLPVACSDTTSLPETGGDAVIRMSPRDRRSIASAAETLWRDGVKREELVEAGLRRCRLFTWERNASIVAGVIEEVLKELR